MPTNFNEKQTPVSQKQHICHKKKNTYIIKVNSPFMPTSLHSGCKMTPLAVVSKNGAPVQCESGWMKCTPFPNPFAAQMSAQYTSLLPYMDERTARTIIEYLDKDTGDIVATVFPTGFHVPDGYETNFLFRMNHASRRDFIRQVKLREAAITQREMDYRNR